MAQERVLGRRRGAVRSRTTLVALVVLGTTLLGACQPPYVPRAVAPLLGAPAPGSTLVGCDQAATVVVLTADAHLDPSCSYTRGVEIHTSGVTLDCRGARIEDPTRTRQRGILISAPADQVLSGVTVRNCVVTGFLNNVRVQRTGFKDLPLGAEYEHPFADIVVEHSTLHASRGSGVFVDGYVTDVTLRDLHIAGSGSVGIYLEAGSKGNVVEDNVIEANGYADVRADGEPITVAGNDVRYLSTGREGIAIDGSRDNVVRGNDISRNANGAILLYKNCGEFATEQPAQWWTRPYGATGNLIEGNRIHDERNGVWVGSRMSQNQLFMDCSDPTYRSDVLTRIHRDVASDNVIRDNEFDQVQRGVRVEDDRTVVEGNTFTSRGSSSRAVIIGTRDRTQVLDEPVTGTVLTGNVADLGRNVRPYTWIHGHTATTFSGNSAEGAVVPLVAGEQPPIDPFLFVVAFWAA